MVAEAFDFKLFAIFYILSASLKYIKASSNLCSSTNMSPKVFKMLVLSISSFPTDFSIIYKAFYKTFMDLSTSPFSYNKSPRLSKHSA
mmetsp:Transcript_11190/g.999  ORF Transcript_11190/g.999 Transcript_11190/m.999 type:complete len:88 (-) Transcript_11190:48-311(-)